MILKREKYNNLPWGLAKWHKLLSSLKNDTPSSRKFGKWQFLGGGISFFNLGRYHYHFVKIIEIVVICFIKKRVYYPFGP